MLNDHNVKLLLRQWVASLDASERDTVEEELGVRLQAGTPVDGHCMDADGNRIGLVGAWVERRLGLSDGGIHFTVSLPPEAEGAEANRLILHGPKADGSLGYAAIPMGKVEGGKVEVHLPARATSNCPIDLDQASVVAVELVPLPWFARLLAHGAVVSHAAQSIWADVNAWLEHARQRTAWAPAVAHADTRSTALEEEEHEFDDGVLVMRLLITHKGEVLITFKAKDDSLDNQVVSFPVEASTATGEAIDVAFLVLTKLTPNSLPSATIRLQSLGEMAIEQGSTATVTEELLWLPEHLPALQWSLARAQTTAGKERLRHFIDSIGQLCDNT